MKFSPDNAVIVSMFRASDINAINRNCPNSTSLGLPATPAAQALKAEAEDNDLLLEAARLINALDIDPIERLDIVRAVCRATNRTR